MHACMRACTYIMYIFSIDDKITYELIRNSDIFWKIETETHNGEQFHKDPFRNIVTNTLTYIIHEHQQRNKTPVCACTGIYLYN